MLYRVMCITVYGGCGLFHASELSKNDAYDLAHKHATEHNHEVRIEVINYVCTVFPDGREE